MDPRYPTNVAIRGENPQVTEWKLMASISIRLVIAKLVPPANRSMFLSYTTCKGCINSKLTRVFYPALLDFKASDHSAREIMLGGLFR
jgi:hypothetical protein